jgi:acetyl esterase/lipase
MVAGPVRAVLSFFAGWLTSELALHHVLWQSAATAIFGSLGAFSHWPGQLGLVITLTSWLGLAESQRRAGLARHAVDAALSRSLGPEVAAARVARRDWRRLAMPFPIGHPGVEKLRDIQFARAGGVDLKLDVYRPRNPGRDLPVLLQIHGGAWMIGDKREQALPLMHRLTSQGWVCVSANYRLSPHATFPDHIIDCKRALAWVRDHIAEHGGDPSWVAVTGGSAGGHLASLLALTPNEPRFQPGFETVDTRVRACVSFYGVYDFHDRHGSYPNRGFARTLERYIMKGGPHEIPELWDLASPISHVRSDAPPFFVTHGDRDTLVPVAQARHFVRALAEKSQQPVVYAEIPGAQHAFELFPSLRALAVIEGVERFLAWTRSADQI